MLGHRRHAWRANDGPFIAVFESSIPSSTKKISNDPRMHVVLSPLNEKSHLKQSLGSKVRVPTTDFFGTYFYWSMLKYWTSLRDRRRRFGRFWPKKTTFWWGHFSVPLA